MLFFTNEVWKVKRNKMSSNVSVELCVSGIFFLSKSVIFIYHLIISSPGG